MPDMTCPKCGADATRKCYWPIKGMLYKCGTRNDYGEFYRTDDCRIRELEQANARLQSVLDATGKDGWEVLKVANATIADLRERGDGLAKAAVQVVNGGEHAEECGLYNGGSCDCYNCAIDSALARWREATAKDKVKE